ncbi:oxidoreductase, aldo/keto reductase family protein [Teladorsagia circumcincta]|uniref:Oxidoreductase, aldo/keto reductase family protein n=1 Tax=Teladorsagia circumcincta TaxID=45464 RepID=A0A2G9U2H2_TELCI|nr:oxidoreductase, aldo/keto reductase family protein [Teladorsagia circumcincta]
MFQELLPKHKLNRGDIFITTKFHMNADDPAGGARTLVMESLERLRTSYIDMVMIHYPKAQRCDDKDEKNKLHRKLSYLELEKLKNEGKIRSVGVSNYEIRHIEEIKEYSKAFASLARMAPQLVQEPLIVSLAKKHNTDVPMTKLVLSPEEIDSISKLNRNKNYIECSGWTVK